MRPDRFTQLLLTAARTIPDVTSVEAVPADERHKRPYLVALQAGGKTTRWQVVATSAPGDRYSEVEREPVTGAQLALKPTDAAPGTLEWLEHALAAAVLAADQGEIHWVEVYSRRPDPPAVGHGATFHFHDGSRIYLNRA